MRLAGASLLFFLLGISAANADEPQLSTPEGQSNWGRLQISAIGIFQQTDSNYFSGEVAWAPTSDGNESFGLRADIAISLLKNRFGRPFIASHYEILAWQLLHKTWLVEGGGGVAVWHGNGGLSPQATLGLAYGVAETVDRIFFSYSRFFLPENVTHIFRLGFGYDL